MRQHFQMFAAYNRWANAVLFEAAARLDAEELNRNVGGFFGSLFSTMSHVLVADRLWLHRFTGQGPTYGALNARPYDNLADLAAARVAEDERIVAWIDGLGDDQLQATITYMPVSNPVPVSHKLAPGLSHLFNHQTHHRGQCHMTLTALGKPSLSLDLIYFLRQEGRLWL